MPKPIVPHVTPSDIDVARPFWEIFGSMQIDAAATQIMEFCQRRGRGWEPILLAELQALSTDGRPQPAFRHLRDVGYVVIHDGEMSLTPEFILRCRQAAPR